MSRLILYEALEKTVSVFDFEFKRDGFIFATVAYNFVHESVIPQEMLIDIDDLQGRITIVGMAESLPFDRTTIRSYLSATDFISDMNHTLIDQKNVGQWTYDLDTQDVDSADDIKSKIKFQYTFCFAFEEKLGSDPIAVQLSAGIKAYTETFFKVNKFVADIKKRSIHFEPAFLNFLNSADDKEKKDE